MSIISVLIKAQEIVANTGGKKATYTALLGDENLLHMGNRVGFY